MWLLAATVSLALASSWSLTHCAKQLGHRFGILDLPDQGRKRHERATPRTGGLAICLTMLAGTFALAGYQAAGNDVGAPSHFAWLLLLSTGLLCGLGLWDDKCGLRARTKLAWQVVAILPFVCWGRPTTAINLFGWQLEWTALTVPLILFWLVSCTNFVNLMDGLDGLASTVGLIIALAVAALAVLEKQTEVGLLSMLLAGALLGFLLHNWPPARIFLGDSGSLPLGFLVGALSLEASAKKAAGLTIAVPFVLLSIPMFDTSMAILRRKLNGRKIGQGDRAHIHHCLRDRGLSARQTLAVIAGLCAATSIAAVLSTAFDNGLIAIGTSVVLLALLVVGRVFGFDETVLLLKHLQAVGTSLRRLPRDLRGRFVMVRMADSVAAGRTELWHKIVIRARRLAVADVEFVCENVATGREIIALAWSADAPLSAAEGAWHVSLNVPRGEGFCARAQVRGTFEFGGNSAGYHELVEMLTLLCRNWPLHANSSIPTRLAVDSTPDRPRILAPHWQSPHGQHGEAPPSETTPRSASREAA